MKRLTALLLAMIMIISACGCTQSKKTVLDISGAEIDNEIFAYYLDKVISRPADYGLSEKPKKDEAKAAATEECKEYVAVNTMFKNLKLSLSVSEKVGVSETVNNLWVRLKNHYKEIGVSRQTLTKIYTTQAYSDAIFNSVYDKGTDDAESESVIIIIPRSFANSFINCRFSSLWKTANPFVVIISASIIFSSRILSYLPSTIIGLSILINRLTLCNNINEPYY